MAWIATRHPGFAEAMAAPGVIRAAVNQDYAQPEDPVRPGDEVAFFPPVTGG
jgi:molybdopterin synthase sulfur carrier subunit